MPSDSSYTAHLQIVLDGYLILWEQELKAAGRADPTTLMWNIPLGLGGSPHYIGVTVRIRP